MKVADLPTSLVIFIKDNHSEARYAHIAWTPSSVPNSIVLLGGTRLTAEIVPGIKSNQRKSSNSQVEQHFHLNTMDGVDAG